MKWIDITPNGLNKNSRQNNAENLDKPTELETKIKD